MEWFSHRRVPDGETDPALGCGLACVCIPPPFARLFSVTADISLCRLLRVNEGDKELDDLWVF